MRCRKAEPQETFAALPKGDTRSEPDIGLIDETLGQGHAIVLAFHLEKEIEGALRAYQVYLRKLCQTLAHDVPRLSASRHQVLQISISVAQGCQATVLQNAETPEVLYCTRFP